MAVRRRRERSHAGDQPASPETERTVQMHVLLILLVCIPPARGPVARPSGQPCRRRLPSPSGLAPILLSPPRQAPARRCFPSSISSRPRHSRSNGRRALLIRPPRRGRRARPQPRWTTPPSDLLPLPRRPASMSRSTRSRRWPTSSRSRPSSAGPSTRKSSSPTSVPSLSQMTARHRCCISPAAEPRLTAPTFLLLGPLPQHTSKEYLERLSKCASFCARRCGSVAAHASAVRPD